MKKFIKKPLTLLSIVYILFRLPALTSLPIGNDESIYIDWGYRSTHNVGYLYYSMYDAKQPLMLWLFGLFEHFISDPLYAARLVSVILGFITMLGIYQLTKSYFNKKLAVVSSLLYIFVPIFVLYDRQALLESGVAASGVWSAYFILRAFKTGEFKYSSLLGVSLGLGFFSKSTALLFLLTAIIIFAYKIFKTKSSVLFKHLSLTVGVFIATALLIFINPKYWETLPSNSRYVYTLTDLIRFPFGAWVSNFLANSEINFMFLTPLVFIFSLIGIYFVIKTKKNKILVFWFLLPLFFQVLTVKSPSQRYIVSLLPLACIFAVYAVYKLFSKTKFFYLSIIVLMILPVFFSLLQIYSPISYFTFSKKVSRFGEASYIEGHLSGYGIPETVNYLKNIAKKKKIVVAYAENTGNPESAMIAYFQKDKNIPHAYLKRDYFSDLLVNKDCVVLESGQEVYFVSRNEQRVGLDTYLEKVKTIPKLSGEDTIGIYHLKNKCSNPLKVNLTFVK